MHISYNTFEQRMSFLAGMYETPEVGYSFTKTYPCYAQKYLLENMSQ